jgi:hypothetical protein
MKCDKQCKIEKQIEGKMEKSPDTFNASGRATCMQKRSKKYIIFEKLELGHNFLGPSCVHAAA